MSGKSIFNPKYIPLIATIGLFVLMFGVGSVSFPGFFALQNFYYLLIDNAYLIIMAVGMSLVIFSGGIDLSVGSLLALTTMFIASLVEKHHLDPIVVLPLVLAFGTFFGAFQGYLIQAFNLPPFIVTLGGLYLARGLCYIVSIDTIALTHPFFTKLSEFQLNVIGDNFISFNVILAVIMTIVGIFLAHYSKFGRTTYAIGGNEQSALLMGLPVARTKILIYTFNGIIGNCFYLLYAIRICPSRKRNGNGCHCFGRNWRRFINRWCRICYWHSIWSSHLWYNSGFHYVSRHAYSLVDQNRHWFFSVCFLFTSKSYSK